MNQSIHGIQPPSKLQAIIDQGLARIDAAVERVIDKYSPIKVDEPELASDDLLGVLVDGQMNPLTHLANLQGLRFREEMEAQRAYNRQAQHMAECAVFNNCAAKSGFFNGVFLSGTGAITQSVSNH